MTLDETIERLQEIKSWGFPSETPLMIYLEGPSKIQVLPVDIIHGYGLDEKYVIALLQKDP